MICYHATEYTDTVENKKEIQRLRVGEGWGDDVAAVWSDVVITKEDGPEVLYNEISIFNKNKL